VGKRFGEDMGDVVGRDGHVRISGGRRGVSDVCAF